ncbi:3-keto-disaccharide hydrolase [Bryobacter aggregatus]|uniref:3-keto-disaccharide hydrolase n=1 Tax=Bryobacter aggregatus TaxID=360054 RepID=UPI0004E10C0E|nr:DUF1080 domain-containing protein [Bryobacter aggregatus]
MQRLALSLLLVAGSLPAASPFVGRWDFNITTPGGNRASWLGIQEKNGALEVWFQPTGGNVFKLDEVSQKGNHLTLTVGKATQKGPATTWDLEAAGDKLTGTMKRGETTTALNGVRAPELKRPMPKAWTKPEPLFNGKDLTGWEPIGKPSDSHWVVKDGYLVNEDHGANLKSTRSFDDFKLHFEVNCPDHANSGFYLRGRYELQLESEAVSHNPPERRIGSIYGRIAPEGDLPRKTDVWDSFDVTLVGRTVTVVRNGVTTINAKEIEGITGGALDANEGEPGPFYIQGDHTGGLKFRNITVAVPKR